MSVKESVAELRERVLSELSGARVALLAATRDVPYEQRFVLGVAPDRSVKDMLSESIAWESCLLTRIQQLDHGETPDWQEFYEGVENWLAMQVQHKRSLTWTEILREYYWVREETHITLSAFSDDFFRQTFPYPGPGGQISIADLLLNIARRDRRSERRITDWWQRQSA